jgi:hypothetical protein
LIVNLLRIETGLSYEPDFHKNVPEFSCTSGMSTIDINENVEVVEQSDPNSRKRVIVE